MLLWSAVAANSKFICNAYLLQKAGAFQPPCCVWQLPGINCMLSERQLWQIQPQPANSGIII